MSKLKFRMRFNEGRKGIPLEKLEKIATEMGKARGFTLPARLTRVR